MFDSLNSLTWVGAALSAKYIGKHNLGETQEQSRGFEDPSTRMWLTFLLWVIISLIT